MLVSSHSDLLGSFFFFSYSQFNSSKLGYFASGKCSINKLLNKNKDHIQYYSILLTIGFLNIYYFLFIWLHWILVAMHRIFARSYNMWDLVP